jgi:8-amino-7-oxononanoate synthase
MEQLDTGTMRRQLEALERQQQYRLRRKVEAVPDTRHPERVRVDGRMLVNFCSNDYLGLRTHPHLIAAAGECMQRYGFGAGAAHLVCGHTREHAELEAELAEFVGFPRALLFSNGYLANLGVISALTGRHHVIVADRLNHASLVDAAQLAGARLRRYAHGDAAACERLLGSQGDARLVVTDGVFSMDGDVAPLLRLSELARAHGAWLVVDDAHGIGVLGERGRGSLELAGLDVACVPVLVGTLGKALGGFGAFVAGEAILIETLIQHSRSYVYTTALPPAVAAAARAALRLVRREPWRQQQLHRLVARFRVGALSLGLPLAGSQTPIQPLIVGDSARALALSEALMEQGFWVGAIRPPTVPRGSARLRVTLSAAHDESQVDALLGALAQVFARESAHAG